MELVAVIARRKQRLLRSSGASSGLKSSGTKCLKVAIAKTIGIPRRTFGTTENNHPREY